MAGPSDGDSQQPGSTCEHKYAYSNFYYYHLVADTIATQISTPNNYSVRAGCEGITINYNVLTGYKISVVSATKIVKINVGFAILLVVLPFRRIWTSNYHVYGYIV